MDAKAQNRLKLLSVAGLVFVLVFAGRASAAAFFAGPSESDGVLELSRTGGYASLLGQETVETPNYLIIWVLAIAIISGLIIEITKLKPGWFRVFMATSYTALPLVVNYYAKNIIISFAIIAIQTTILTALWFKQWKARKVSQWMRGLENRT